MALHVGECELREGDYYGVAVNRCARVRSLAHGGQVLLTRAVRDEVHASLPPDTALRDLGQYRLRDLQQPEHLFQLLHPDLPTGFPPLRSRMGLPNNLPQHLTSFVGREREMAEVRRRMKENRLLTLTGPGGTGKTRLSLQFAAEWLDADADHDPQQMGAWQVNLAPLVDQALVPQAVAQVLGVREEPGRPLVNTLTDTLRPKHLLLILDNCEHVLRASAALAQALLERCPHVAVLATSREALGIAGEAVYRLPSLSLPPSPSKRSGAGRGGGAEATLEHLVQSEAVRLFVDRAVAVTPSFAVTGANAPAVAQICHRLDGIPLAIELAAARIKALSIEHLLLRLDDRFRLLKGEAGPQCHASRRCVPSSIGAMTCLPSRSVRSSGRFPCLPAVGRHKQQKP